MRVLRRRGNLLVELSVAIAVAIAGIGALLARAQSTAKTGREVELMNQLMTDCTSFARSANNLHAMGGPNYVANTSSIGVVAQEYGEYLQRNYPINSITIATIGAAVQFSGFIYLNAGLGTQSEIGSHGTPQAGAQLMYVEGANNDAPPLVSNPNVVQVAYYIVQTAPLAVENATGLGGGAGGPPDYSYVQAGNVPPATGINPQNPSTVSEGVGASLCEDPNTGIVSIVAPFAFGSVDLLNNPATPGVPNITNFPFFGLGHGAGKINVFPQPNNF